MARVSAAFCIFAPSNVYQLRYVKSTSFSPKNKNLLFCKTNISFH